MDSMGFEDLGLELPCVQCGQTYRLPLKTVMLSAQMMHEGCPLADERECVPVFYDGLVDAALVRELGEILKRLARQAGGSGGRVVMLGRH